MLTARRALRAARSRLRAGQPGAGLPGADLPGAELAGAEQARDAGISLTELLVAMVLSVILGSVTMMLFTRVSGSVNSTTDRTISSSQARNALQAWSGYLQVLDDPTSSGTGVNRFGWIASNSVLFYADLNNRSGAVNTTAAPTMIWLRLDSAQQLVEEMFPARPARYPATATTCRILVYRASASQLFTAFAAEDDLTGTPLGAAETAGTGCQQLPTAPAPNQLSVANLQNVTAVAIAFNATDATKSHTFSFATTVPLPAVAGL